MKKLVALLCVVMLTLSMSLTAFAKDPIISPENTPDTSDTTGDSKAPQTGDIVVYVAAGVVILTTVAAVAKKKMSVE